MNYIKCLLPIAAGAVLFSCKGPVNESPQQSAHKTDSTNTIFTQQCYRHVDGIHGEDTTRIDIINTSNVITGIYEWKPFEKDARTGSLSGILEGDVIKGIWVYMQEGIKDSIPVEFKVSGDTIFQKSFKVDAVTGRQITDSSAGYTIAFAAVDCDQNK